MRIIKELMEIWLNEVCDKEEEKIHSIEEELKQVQGETLMQWM